MQLRENEFLFIQGDAGDRLYIVRTGKLRRFRRVNDQIQNMGEYGPGSIFGEMALLDNAVHEYTLQALQDCELRIIDQAFLQKEMGKYPRWLPALLYALLQKIKQHNYLEHKQTRARAFPALLWNLQTTPDEIQLNTLCHQMHLLCGIEEWDTRQLLQACTRLNLVEIRQEHGQEVIIPLAPSILSKVSQVLLARNQKSPDPAWVLSAGEQRILDCWLEAARLHGQSNQQKTQVTQEQFQQCLHEHMPGVKLGVMALRRLQQNAILEVQALHILANYDEILEILDSQRLLQRIETELPYLLENF